MLKNTRKYIAPKLLIIVLIMITFQTITFLTISHESLKNKLLPNYIVGLNRNSDSLFVRDFYISDCFTGDDNKYLSHDLYKCEQEIKQKFNVKYVHFQSKTNFDFNDSTQNRYNLIYTTWTKRSNWKTMFEFYSITQTETLIVNKRYNYKRLVKYRWLLFFWIPIFERIESIEH